MIKNKSAEIRGENSKHPEDSHCVSFVLKV